MLSKALKTILLEVNSNINKPNVLETGVWNRCAVQGNKSLFRTKESPDQFTAPRSAFEIIFFLLQRNGVYFN